MNRKRLAFTVSALVTLGGVIAARKLQKRYYTALNELISGKNKFATMVRILQRVARLAGRPPSSQESHLASALYNLAYLKHCYAEIDVYDIPFYFDVLRLPYEGVVSLIERIHLYDCYRFKDILPEDPVVVDAGAHIGVFPRYVLGEKPQSTVYALEPDRDNFKLLTMNLEPFERAFCSQKGVLDKKDALEFYTSRKIDWRSSLLVKRGFEKKPDFEPGEYTTAYRVEVTDIDSFVSEAGLEKLDLLKITVPGEIEHLVLAGAVQTIEAFRPQISIAVYPVNMPEVEEFFEKVGGYRGPCPYRPPNRKRSDINIFQPL